MSRGRVIDRNYVSKLLLFVVVVVVVVVVDDVVVVFLMPLYDVSV